MTLEHLTRESLSEQLNTKFRLNAGAEKFVEVELIEVVEGFEAAGQDSFSAVFRGSLEEFFPQGTYLLEHERLGSFELFLVPIRRDAEGFAYEAVFNRLKE
ncbi:MAG TPA: hypothetical protein VJ842_00660 [Pyrinomonadaceae bacterium]|nr:hypothetical protein [Pyrinomonadaceae bacterium]